MSDRPALTPEPMNYQSGALIDRDQEHLKILAVCWYVVSGMAAMFGFFPLLYVGMGIMFLKMPSRMGAPPPPAAMGYMFIIMGCCFALFIWTTSILGFLTARSLQKRRRLVLCYVVAALICLQIPIGTALGVFTFIVLARPSVRASFPA